MEETDIENKPDQLVVLEKEIQTLMEKIQISVKHNKCLTYEELIMKNANYLINNFIDQIKNSDFYLSENDDIMFRFHHKIDNDLLNNVILTITRILSIPKKYSFKFNDNNYSFKSLEKIDNEFFKIFFKKD